MWHTVNDRVAKLLDGWVERPEAKALVQEQEREAWAQRRALDVERAALQQQLEAAAVTNAAAITRWRDQMAALETQRVAAENTERRRRHEHLQRTWPLDARALAIECELERTAPDAIAECLTQLDTEMRATEGHIVERRGRHFLTQREVVWNNGASIRARQTAIIDARLTARAWKRENLPKDELTRRCGALLAGLPLIELTVEASCDDVGGPIIVGQRVS
jgi:hypothetical protein